MKKLTTLILSGVVTLGIGASAIFSNGLIASHVMAANLKTESPVAVTDNNISQADVKAENITTPEWEAMKDQLYDHPLKLVRVQATDGSYVIITYDEKDNFLCQTKEGDIIPKFIEGQPDENDISKEKAIENATNELINNEGVNQERVALINNGGISQETVNKFAAEAKLNSAKPDAHVWHISFSPKNPAECSKYATYNVDVNARTGEIECVGVTTPTCFPAAN